WASPEPGRADEGASPVVAKLAAGAWYLAIARRSPDSRRLGRRQHMPPYRSHRTTQGRTQMAARALWRATGTAEADLVKPIVAIANSYTQFVPGHVHLKPLADLAAPAIYQPSARANQFHP